MVFALWDGQAAAACVGLGVRPIAILKDDAVTSDFIFKSEGTEADWEWEIESPKVKPLDKGLVVSASE